MTIKLDFQIFDFLLNTLKCEGCDRRKLVFKRQGNLLNASVRALRTMQSRSRPKKFISFVPVNPLNNFHRIPFEGARYNGCPRRINVKCTVRNARSLPNEEFRERTDEISEKAGRKPYGYWKSLDNILSELQKYMESETCRDKTAMPTYTELRKHGKQELAGAISRKGWPVVATAANLPLSSIVRPRSLNLIFATRLRLTSGRMRPYMYWREFSHLQEALQQVMKELKVDFLPPARQLINIGRSDVARAIRIHGGWREVSKRMKIQCASDAKKLRELGKPITPGDVDTKQAEQENLATKQTTCWPHAHLVWWDILKTTSLTGFKLSRRSMKQSDTKPYG